MYKAQDTSSTDEEHRQHLTDIASQYNGQWKFFQYLTGKGMSIYNMYKYGMGRDVYAKLIECLLQMDGITVQRDAALPMYWNDTCLDGTFPTDMLVNDNIIVDVYSIDIIKQEQREILVNKMKLSHSQYGYLCNYDRQIYYSEWYARDKKTGIIDRIKLLK